MSAAVHEPPDGPHQLLRLLVALGCRRLGDAVAHVPVEQPEGDLVERRLGCCDLRQDVDAVAVVLDHPLDAAHLALGPTQALEQLVLGGGVRPDGCSLRCHAHRLPDTPRGYATAVSDLIDKVGDGLWNAFLMAWEVWWALVLGFFISAVVQAWVPRERIESALSGDGVGPIAKATGLGAASSSCSYAAIAIAKSLFQKGASAGSALAFQFASTNLVWELGLVLWILIGWQFTLAEYVGGLVMIALMWGLLRRFVSPQLEREAREHARHAQAGHVHHSGSGRSWSDVAFNFRGDWKMLYKEITVGFVLAGFIALLGDDFFNGLFLGDAPPAVQTVW